MSGPAGRVPAWRLAVGGIILLALFGLAVDLSPIYIRNLKLQQYVEKLARLPDTPKEADDLIRAQVIEKAAALDLPVKPENIQISRINGDFNVSVRYIVRVDLPLYTVDLHFYPGAGSR